MSETESTLKPDPLQSVADAMHAAVVAAKDGASAATTSVSNALPGLGGLLSRVAYHTSYAISYGVVFPTVFIARSIPQNNPLVHGLHDGANAAKDMISEIKAKQSGGSI